jgi:hypothetical protein
MVASAHTIIHPGAMMIEAVNALIANVAVSRPRSPNYLTLRAQTLRVENLQQFIKVQSRTFYEISWIFKPYKHEENYGNYEGNYQESSHCYAYLHSVNSINEKFNK